MLLIALILGGDFFTGAVLSSALTKLVLRQSELSEDSNSTNALRAEVRAIQGPSERLALINLCFI